MDGKVRREKGNRECGGRVPDSVYGMKILRPTPISIWHQHVPQIYLFVNYVFKKIKFDYYYLG